MYWLGFIVSWFLVGNLTMILCYYDDMMNGVQYKWNDYLGTVGYACTGWIIWFIVMIIFIKQRKRKLEK